MEIQKATTVVVIKKKKKKISGKRKGLTLVSCKYNCGGWVRFGGPKNRKRLGFFGLID